MNENNDNNRNTNHHSIEYNIRISAPYWLIALVAILASIIGYLIYGPQDIDKFFTFTAAAIAVCATVISSVYAAKQYQETKNKISFDKKLHAYNIASKWNSELMTESRKILRSCMHEVKSGKLTNEQLKSLYMENEVEISQVLGFFEEICVAIKNDIADEDFLYDQIRSALCSYERIFKDWIDIIRNDQPAALEWTEKTAHRWRERMQANS